VTPPTAWAGRCGTEPATDWLRWLPQCRQRAWEQSRAAASGLAAVRVVERRVEVRPAGAPTRREWPDLLHQLARRLDDGRIHDRDLANLAGAFNEVLETSTRRYGIAGGPTVIPPHRQG
jgi:hypothetical protein